MSSFLFFCLVSHVPVTDYDIRCCDNYHNYYPRYLPIFLISSSPLTRPSRDPGGSTCCQFLMNCFHRGEEKNVKQSQHQTIVRQKLGRTGRKHHTVTSQILYLEIIETAANQEIINRALTRHCARWRAVCSLLPLVSDVAHKGHYCLLSSLSRLNHGTETIVMIQCPGVNIELAKSINYILY